MMHADLQRLHSQHQPTIEAHHQTLQQALQLLGARQQAVQQVLAAVQAGTLLPRPASDGAAAMSVSVPELGGATQDALQRLAASLLLPALATGAASTPQQPQEQQELAKQQHPLTWQPPGANTPPSARCARLFWAQSGIGSHQRLWTCSAAKS